MRIARWTGQLIALSLSILLSGCAAEDGGSSAPTDENGVPVLAGLWIGTIDETAASSGTATAATTELDTHIFFMETKVYVLREDQGLSGTYVQDGLGGISMELATFEYADPDTDNQFFVGTDNRDSLTVSALLASDINLVGSYANTQRDGEINVELDEARDRELTFKDLEGTWTTTDSETYINGEGRFHGFDTSNSCRWDGQLIPLTDQILELSILRENCDEFNDSAMGIAITDGEGNLHFISERDRNLLWMRFAPPTPTTPTTDTGTDTETDTDTGTDTDTDAA